MSFIRKSRGSPAPRAELASLMVFGDWGSNPVVTCPRGLRPPWALHGTWEDRGLGSLEGSVLSSRHCPRGRSESPCPPAPGLPLPHPCHKGFTQGPAWPYSKGGSRRRRPGQGPVRDGQGVLLPGAWPLPPKTDLKGKCKEKPKETGGDMAARAKPPSGAAGLGVVSAAADSRRGRGESRPLCPPV